MRRVEKRVLLEMMDNHWRQHLQQIDQLRSVVHLRGYGQRDPLNEFKEEALNLFHGLLGDLRSTVTRSLMNLQVDEPAPEPQPPQQMQATHYDPDTGIDDMNPDAPPADIPQAEDDWSRTSRNAPCPCGSGKKYKHCHGAVNVEV